MSEAEAVEGAKQENVECFQYLYGLHDRRVYSLCLRMTGDIEAAEDLTQEATYLTSMRMVGTLHGTHHII